MIRVLFVNSKVYNCGVYQYGKSVYEILSKDSIVSYDYIEIEAYQDIVKQLQQHYYDSVIYNYHPSTLPWISQHQPFDAHRVLFIDHVGIPSYITSPKSVLHTDPRKENGIPRPLFEPFLEKSSTVRGPVRIGSFGFPQKHKGFTEVLRIVNEQYDHALLNLHLPIAHFVDVTEQRSIIESLHQYPLKPGIVLQTTTDFKSTQQVLEFLSSNDLNLFLYDDDSNGGVSSVIDFALSVYVPIGLSRSRMFEHVFNDSMCVYERPLSEIINAGLNATNIYRSMWSNDNLRRKVRKALMQLPLHFNGQAGQDAFAYLMTILDKSQPTSRFYIDIGCNDPMTYNNSLLLELKGWNGISIDILDLEHRFISQRKNKFLKLDVTRDKLSLIVPDMPCIIDYLSFDVDDATSDALDNFPWESIRCKIITIEHDQYRVGPHVQHKIAMKLSYYGYVCLFRNVIYQGLAFEDWWVLPEYFDPSVRNQLRAENIAFENCISRIKDLLSDI